eukprot:TRINITY_DN28116_c0_g1_i1.p1 TRINITY_DN28116_c0_g1~~TRINITY_DN28116_c0_g1_i1.p1  ORF type:complete len:174 (-),score=21.00 TRINITY_DN28116_c0_g1_i1:81-566(-)
MQCWACLVGLLLAIAQAHEDAEHRLNVTFTHFGDITHFYYLCEGPGSGGFPGTDKTAGNCDDQGQFTPEKGGSAHYNLCHFTNSTGRDDAIEFILRMVNYQGVVPVSYYDPCLVSIGKDSQGKWNLKQSGKMGYIRNYSFSSDDQLLVDLADSLADGSLII